MHAKQRTKNKIVHVFDVIQIRLEFVCTTVDWANLFSRLLIVKPIPCKHYGHNHEYKRYQYILQTAITRNIAMKSISANNTDDTPNVRFAKGIPSCLNDMIHFSKIRPKFINSKYSTSLFHKRSRKLVRELKVGS